MICDNEIPKQVETSGRAWLRNAVSADELAMFKELSSLDSRPGARVLRSTPLFRSLETASFNKRIAELWPGVRPVRLISFDKNTATNWAVPWHQDRVIAVKSQKPTSGYSNWSKKSGTWHCEPPTELLQKMLFVRVHLDESTEDNGAMEIAVGSHCEGSVPAASADAIASVYKSELTIADPGDVLVLAMLTLHRSRASKSNNGRRALRVDYAPGDWPMPFDWAT